MIIAKQKKKENIGEYILYMWQVEDLIRANAFDLDNIYKNIIKHFNQPEETEREIREWYEGLCAMMIEEGIREKGHLQININTMIDLTGLHGRLLGMPEHLSYQQLFSKVFPLIREFREKAQNSVAGDIELAFIALYSFWMLKLQKRSVSEETQQAMQSFSELISALAQVYHKRERGEIEI